MNTQISNVINQTMTLKEITDLLDVRHNNAMRIVDEMVKNQDFGLATQIEYPIKTGKGRTQYVKTYQLDKRQSIAVAARLNTSLMMRVIDRLEELETQQQLPHPTNQIALNNSVLSSFQTYAAICEVAGITGNAKTLAANNATIKMTGVNALEDMGLTHLIAEKQEQFYTPSDIGKRIGMRIRMVNPLLEKMGMQVGRYDHKVRRYYELTEKGKKHGMYLDTGVKAGTMMIKQVKWYESVIYEIKEYLDTQLELV